MQRYFFDLVDRAKAEFDYRGCELTTPERALRRAELIAIDESTQRAGWQVTVSDAAGQIYFCVPVKELPELAILT